MIIPCIDLMGGKAVQLVGGEGAPRYEVSDIMALAGKFARLGEIAIVDLDAARGEGSNDAIIRELCRRFPCRVGGGVRSVERGRELLDSGARRIVVGTKAAPEFFREFPKDRVMAAVDLDGTGVVTEGWRTRTGKAADAMMEELSPFVSGFLVTFVEKEGRLGGTDMEAAKRLLASSGGKRVAFSGGISSAAEIAALDAMGADAQVGMAVYGGNLALADAFAAPLVSDRADGLWPTIVCDERGVALGLAYSNRESLGRAIETGKGVYWSRKRGLWEKGASSGDAQELLRVEPDCDRDAIRFTVRQGGTGFCHTGTRSCFGAGNGLPALERTLVSRLSDAPEGSYTRRLFKDPGLLAAKLAEEAGELARAGSNVEVCMEAADLIYFAMVKAVAAGVALADVERELDRRSLVLTRRKGDAKPPAKVLTGGVH